MLLPEIPVHLCANFATGLFAIGSCGSKKDSSGLPPALALLLLSMMRYSSRARNYPWKTMITLKLTEIENHAEVETKIAKGFAKFCLDEKHNHPEKFVFREVHYADEPKSHRMPPNCCNGCNSESWNSAKPVVRVWLMFPVIMLLSLQRWPPVCPQTVSERIQTYPFYTCVKFHQNQRACTLDISQVVQLTDCLLTAAMDVTVNLGIQHSLLYVCCQYLPLLCCYSCNIGHQCIHKVV